jgi:hypothetical protein
LQVLPATDSDAPSQNDGYHNSQLVHFVSFFRFS